MVNVEKIVEALKKVYDPEIPVNIYDLGLIYDIKVEGNDVKVKMTLTAPGCPLSVYMPSMVEEAIKTDVPKVKNVEVDIVWDPPWTPLKITEEGRRRLKEIYGVDIVEEWRKRAAPATEGKP
ncbi:MAG: iron-sulfur cluster assembly protein [Thermofilaceae archaeon]|nr:iron-sulfur cluster assembly protein [Thermofilaceae archaeon]MDW8004282.1 iron-sulfur cluster assembly protein [Thermofilaceae archaeon]